MLAIAAVAALATQLQQGAITEAQFVAQALTALRPHVQAAGSIGAAQYGGTADSEALDAHTDAQRPYLTRFGADISSGQSSEKQTAARAALYGAPVWSAYQMGKVQAAPAEVTIYWVCQEDERSCEDCIALDGSYTQDTLPTYPGMDVACSGNCRCELWYEVG